MNDSPEFVFMVNEEDANKKLEELAKEYWEKNKATIINNYRLKGDESMIYKEYRKYVYWHIHNVPTNGPVVQRLG